MSVTLPPIAPCVFCGTDPAPFIYTTALCRACAGRSSVALEVRDGRCGISLVRDDARWHWLTYFDADGPDVRRHLEPILVRRSERLALIVSGLASDEDPEFLTRIGDYIAQVGETPSVMRALHQRAAAAEAASAVSEVERLLGLRA